MCDYENYDCKDCFECFVHGFFLTGFLPTLLIATTKIVVVIILIINGAQMCLVAVVESNSFTQGQGQGDVKHCGQGDTCSHSVCGNKNIDIKHTITKIIIAEIVFNNLPIV